MNTPDPQSTAAPMLPEPRLQGRWYLRIPIKCVLFFLIVLFVCFPYPNQLIRNLGRIRNMEAMIEPHAPELAAWDAELRGRIARLASSQPASAHATSPKDIQHEVERFVLEKVKYEWDWNLWGSADYMPTVHEMFEKAKEFDGQVKEDCDGRAVMAASLMRRLGYQATMVTDLRHVWVTTPEGEWMGPGGTKTLVATTQGTEVKWGTAAGNFAISLSYGIAVFPFVRELIILVGLFVLMLRRWSRPGWAAVGFVLLLQGLLFMRLGCFAASTLTREVSSWPTWVGLIHVAGAIGLMITADRRGRRRAGA